jgi:hypothetical protein
MFTFNIETHPLTQEQYLIITSDQPFWHPISLSLAAAASLRDVLSLAIMEATQ